MKNLQTLGLTQGRAVEQASVAHVCRDEDRDRLLLWMQDGCFHWFTPSTSQVRARRAGWEEEHIGVQGRANQSSEAPSHDTFYSLKTLEEQECPVMMSRRSSGLQRWMECWFAGGQGTSCL